MHTILRHYMLLMESSTYDSMKIIFAEIWFEIVTFYVNVLSAIIAYFFKFSPVLI